MGAKSTQPQRALGAGAGVRAGPSGPVTLRSTHWAPPGPAHCDFAEPRQGRPVWYPPFQGHGPGYFLPRLSRVRLGQGTDPRLWLPWESRSSSPSSTLATFFSLLDFFCGGRVGSGPAQPADQPWPCAGQKLREAGLPSGGGWYQVFPAGPAGPLPCTGRPGPERARGVGWCAPGGEPSRHLPQQPLADDVASSPGGGGFREAGQGPWGLEGMARPAGTGTAGPAGRRSTGGSNKVPRLGAPPYLALGEAAHEDPVVASAGPGVLPRLHVLLRLGDRETGAAGGAQPQAQSSGWPPQNEPEGAGARAGGAAATPGPWEPGPRPPGGLRGRCRGPGSKRGVEGSAGPPGCVALNPFRPQFCLFPPQGVSV